MKGSLSPLSNNSTLSMPLSENNIRLAAETVFCCDIFSFVNKVYPILKFCLEWIEVNIDTVVQDATLFKPVEYPLLISSI